MFFCFAFAIAHDSQVLSAPLVIRIPSAAAVCHVFPSLECPKIAWACSMFILIASVSSCTLSLGWLSPLSSLIPAATSPLASGRRMYAHHITPFGVSTLMSNLMTRPPFLTDRLSFLFPATLWPFSIRALWGWSDCYDSREWRPHLVVLLQTGRRRSCHKTFLEDLLLLTCSA